jgi:small-conductance mechanosensitive channel
MMITSWLLEERHLMRLAQPALVFGIAFAGMLVVRYVFLRVIRHASSGPKSSAALLADALRIPSILWALAAALDIGLRYADLNARQVEKTDKWIGAFIIVSLTLVAASAAIRMMTEYGERQGMPFAMAGLSRTLIRVAVTAIGVTSLLANFDIAITPLLTALGVGGLAVALALQDTLANFFAGIHILVERPVFVGDLIRLEGGQEGVVTDIGWRTTRVRTGGNDIVVIPNTKITSGILVNCSLPQPRTVAEIAILVAHGADIEQVRGIALEEAARTGGVLADPAPAFMFDPGVLLTHIQCKLFVNVASRGEQFGVASEIRTRLLVRFRTEGVPLPNPELVHSDRR